MDTQGILLPDKETLLHWSEETWKRLGEYMQNHRKSLSLLRQPCFHGHWHLIGPELLHAAITVTVPTELLHAATIVTVPTELLHAAT